MKSKVKVKVSALLSAVEQRRDDMVSAHRAEMTEYLHKRGVYREEVFNALELLGAKMSSDPEYLPETSYHGGITVPVSVSRPGEPSLNTTRIDRLISTLKMAADDAILVSAEDAADYLG
jgi:hypothetical protein